MTTIPNDSSQLIEQIQQVAYAVDRTQAWYNHAKISYNHINELKQSEATGTYQFFLLSNLAYREGLNILACGSSKDTQILAFLIGDYAVNLTVCIDQPDATSFKALASKYASGGSVVKYVTREEVLSGSSQYDIVYMNAGGWDPSQISSQLKSCAIVVIDGLHGCQPSFTNRYAQRCYSVYPIASYKTPRYNKDTWGWGVMIAVV